MLKWPNFERCKVAAWVHFHIYLFSKSFSAYTTPTFTFSGGTLDAQASRWFPEPNVTWYNHVHKVLEARTSLFQNSAGIFSVASMLEPINRSEVYTFQIGNKLVTAVSQAKVGGKFLYIQYFNFQ